MEEIQAIKLSSQFNDLAVWKQTSHGRFTMKVAWESCRSKKPYLNVEEFLWDNVVILTSSIFLWRLIQYRLPLDEQMKHRGFDYFNVPLFCRIGNLCSSFYTLTGKGLHARKVVPLLILWYVWTTGNNAKHRIKISSVPWIITGIIQHLLRAQKPKFAGVKFLEKGCTSGFEMRFTIKTKLPAAGLKKYKLWIFHDWTDEESVKLLEKCKDAIIPSKNGGKVIIVKMIVDDEKEDHEATETQLFFDMLMMVDATGKERTEKEWAKLFFSCWLHKL
ncbi:hypothetical protein Pfo_022447 [Paulownia fortunei]|nr:hypothetical protein Pfo_022447 [Paulownia fortunei]